MWELLLLFAVRKLGAPKRRTIVRSLLLLFLCALPGHSQGACPWYSKLATFIFPIKRPVSDESFDKAKTKWDSVLATDKNIALETLLAKLNEEGASSPESLMALMDSLGPKGHLPFKEWLARLEEKGIQVRFRTMGNQEKLGRHDELRWKWTLSKAVPPMQKKAKVLDIWLPDTPPKNAKELLARLYTLSAAFSGAELEMTARKAPLFSIPVGSWENSYPKQLRDAVRRAEERVYGTIHEWESRWGKAPLDLPAKGTGNWHGSYATLPLMLSWRSIFPFYNPVAKYRANQKGYEKYKEGLQGTQHGGLTPLERDIKNRFQIRGTEKYIVDTYLRFLQTWGAVALIKGTYKLGVALKDGTLRAALATSARFVNGLRDPDKLNEDLKEYTEDEVGDPVVNAFYDEQIEVIKKEIATKGDPHGELAKKIRVLISERDFLKN